MGGRGSSRFITILHRGGSPQFITILHRGGLQNLLQYYSFERKMEGYNTFSALNKLKGFHFILFYADLLQYYKGEGGVSRDPKFLLRNIWTAPNTSNFHF